MNRRYIFGFDLETTGLVAGTDKITEVAGVLWDWQTKQPVQIMSHFVKHTGLPISNEITDLTGIESWMLEQFGLEMQTILAIFGGYASAADAVMAHNAPFDVGFLKVEGLEFNGKTVIDSRTDLPFNRFKHPSTKLTHLMASHGFLNPFPHRALFDVLTMLKIASHYDLDEILARAVSPTITLIAKVSIAEKDKAKSVGFQFENVTKTWRLNVKEIDIPKLKFNFDTVRL